MPNPKHAWIFGSWLLRKAGMFVGWLMKKELSIAHLLIGGVVFSYILHDHYITAAITFVLGVVFCTLMVMLNKPHR